MLKFKRSFIDTRAPAAHQQYYVAIHPYSAIHDGDMTLQVGDVIRVQDILDNGWWQGTMPDGRSGYFPGSYVQPVCITHIPTITRKFALSLQSQAY